MITQQNLAQLPLPPHTHAQLLTARDVVDGSQLTHVAVWADRHYDRCPRCHQHINIDPGCPVILNAGAGQGGATQETSQQHGCGYWLNVLFDTVAVDDDDDTAVVEHRILDAAKDLATGRGARIEAARDNITAALREDLAAAIERLGEPLEDGETREDREREVLGGTETEPGVYREAGEPRVWAYGPVDDGDPIIVTAADLAPAVAA